MSAINEICSIMEENWFGQYFFQVLTTLRNALLINSILSNASVWYNLKQKEIDQLEKWDSILMARGLSSSKKTSPIIMYLELGWTPIRFLLKSRRIMFLHYLLNEKTDSLLFKFFQAQLNSQIKGDWILTVKQDMIDIKLNHYTFNQIKQMSK